MSIGWKMAVHMSTSTAHFQQCEPLYVTRFNCTRGIVPNSIPDWPRNAHGCDLAINVSLIFLSSLGRSKVNRIKLRTWIDNVKSYRGIKRDDTIKYQCLKFIVRNPRDVVANMFDSNIGVSEFQLQPCYYVHLQTNTLGKGMNLLIPPAMG